MNEQIKQYIIHINKVLEEIDLTGQPDELYEPIRYILDMDGKRIRPLLTLLSYGLFRENIQEVIQPALAVEIFHNFTLMHDDIMDNAPLRRGNVTVHERWDENIAILSGDAMLVKAYDQLLHVPEIKIREVIGKFNQCAVQVCEGQQYDMNFESADTVTVNEYLHMIKLKTAVLLGFALEFGAILADVDPADQKELHDLGINIGIGFQLKDDLLDVYADDNKFGKQVGGDIIANKKTFLLITAFDRADDKQRRELDHWLGLKVFDPDLKVKAIKEIYKETGVRALTEKKMNGFFEEAFRNLHHISVNEEKKSNLKYLIEYLVSRES